MYVGPNLGVPNINFMTLKGLARGLGLRARASVSIEGPQNNGSHDTF